MFPGVSLNVLIFASFLSLPGFVSLAVLLLVALSD